MLLSSIFDVVFQQRTHNDAGAILLHLRQNLIERLRTGVVDFQLSGRVSAGGSYGLWLGGRAERQVVLRAQWSAAEVAPLSQVPCRCGLCLYRSRRRGVLRPQV